MSLGEKRMGKGDFWELWQSQKKFLFNICFKYTGNYHDAQDLLSEVMIKAHEKINKKLMASNPDGWVVQLIRNTYIDKYRRMYDRDVNITYTDNSEKHEINSKLILSTPVDEICEQELSQLLNHAYSEMPTRRRLFTRLYFSGYSYSDICKAFDIRSGTLRQMIAISRHELRGHLELFQKGFSQEVKEDSDKSKNRKVYNHLLQVRENGATHYCNFICSLSTHRLPQRARALTKYLDEHPHSNDKRFSLAVNLSAQGKLYQALNILRKLTSDNYISEEVYDLQIKLLKLLNRDRDIQHSAESAINLLPSAPCRFHVWLALAQGRKEKAENILKANIRPNFPDIDLRILLVKVYILQKKNTKAYSECEKIALHYPWHPEIYAYHLQRKLIVEGYLQAKEFARQNYEHNSKSAIACFYHLHFLVISGNESELKSLLTHVRKRYYWHPDFTLIKALLSPDKKTKILKRRCADYPECALSQHYLNYFSKYSSAYTQLNTEEARHLEIVKMIYEHKKGLSND